MIFEKRPYIPEETRPHQCCTARRQKYGLAALAGGLISFALAISLISLSVLPGGTNITRLPKNESGTTAPLELIGSWNDGFDTIVLITATNWTELYADNTVVVRHIHHYTNPVGDGEGIIIAQNDRNNTWYASKWNRIHYFHYRPEIWHFCTVYYDKDTQEAAETPPDHPELFNVDNVTSGCGGFPMSVLLPVA